MMTIIFIFGAYISNIIIPLEVYIHNLIAVNFHVNETNFCYGYNCIAKKEEKNCTL